MWHRCVLFRISHLKGEAKMQILCRAALFLAILALTSEGASAAERPKLPPRTPTENPKMLEAWRALCDEDPNMRWIASTSQCLETPESERLDIRVIRKYLFEDEAGDSERRDYV